MANGMDAQAITAAATQLADAIQADILLYNGDIERSMADAIFDLCRAAPRRENLMLFLCTRGGDPDAAFRMVRWLHTFYKRLIVVICGRCKSAGTLVAVGAHELVMTDYAEMGPLDIQLGKKDELYEMDSGLTVLNALAELEEKAFEVFEQALYRLKVQSEGRITLKFATQVASELAKGMMTPIMQQIDPLHIGEVSRALQIGKEYGSRLATASKNLPPPALDRLVNEYPSHRFVIDREEAKTLFVKVREPTNEELELAEMLGVSAKHPQSKDKQILFFISDKKQEPANDSNHEAGPGDSTAQTAARAGTDAETVGATQSAEAGGVVAAFVPRSA